MASFSFKLIFNLFWEKCSLHQKLPILTFCWQSLISELLNWVYKRLNYLFHSSTTVKRFRFTDTCKAFYQNIISKYWQNSIKCVFFWCNIKIFYRKGGSESFVWFVTENIIVSKMQLSMSRKVISYLTGKVIVLEFLIHQRLHSYFLPWCLELQ